jgi:enoyl-CoA hydratase
VTGPGRPARPAEEPETSRSEDRNAARAGPVSVARDGSGLAVVTVDAPPLNLYDGAMQAALVAGLDDLEGTAPRAVLFRFAGSLVTGGVDVAVFDAVGGDVAAATALFTDLLSLTRRVEELPCPTVFAAHALCLTWGFELALACDLILATPTAEFG